MCIRLYPFGMSLLVGSPVRKPQSREEQGSALCDSREIREQDHVSLEECEEENTELLQTVIKTLTRDDGLRAVPCVKADDDPAGSVPVTFVVGIC